MKKIILVAVILLCSCKPLPKEDPVIEVNFSPNGGAMEAIVREIDLAKKEIFIQAYSFTNNSVGNALIGAYYRGVKIEIILDKENLGNPNSLLLPLHEKGISIYLDKQHAIAHNKIVIIDNRIVITGSMNFSRAASESNAENSLIIKDDRLATRYMVNWHLHQHHSPRFNP